MPCVWFLGSETGSLFLATTHLMPFCSNFYSRKRHHNVPQSSLSHLLSPGKNERGGGMNSNLL